MRISVCTLLFADKTFEEAVKEASEIGFDGVEIYGRTPHLPPGTSDFRAREMRSVLEYYGMQASGIDTYLGEFSTDGDDAFFNVQEELKIFLQLCDFLNCNMLRIWSGGPNAFLAEKEQYQKAAERIHACAVLAAQADKKLALEIHNGSLVETAEAASRLLDAVNMVNVGVVHDAANMYITDTNYGEESVEILGKRIFDVHVKDLISGKGENGKDVFRDFTGNGEKTFCHRLLGKGSVNHIPMMRALKKMNYQGWFSAESHVFMPGKEKAAHEFGVLRQQLSQAGF